MFSPQHIRLILFQRILSLFYDWSFNNILFCSTYPSEIRFIGRHSITYTFTAFLYYVTSETLFAFPRTSRSKQICYFFIMSLFVLLQFRRWTFQRNIQRSASICGCHATFLIFSMLFGNNFVWNWRSSITDRKGIFKLYVGPWMIWNHHQLLSE